MGWDSVECIECGMMIFGNKDEDNFCGKCKENELLKIDNELLKSKWEAQGLMIQKLHKEIEQYDKVHMAYILMKDLLIEMNGFSDLESYDTEDIFKLISELEQDN